MRYVWQAARRLPEIQSLPNLFSQSVPRRYGSGCKKGQLVVVGDDAGFEVELVTHHDD